MNRKLLGLLALAVLLLASVAVAARPAIEGTSAEHRAAGTPRDEEHESATAEDHEQDGEHDGARDDARDASDDADRARGAGEGKDENETGENETAEKEIAENETAEAPDGDDGPDSDVSDVNETAKDHTPQAHAAAHSRDAKGVATNVTLGPDLAAQSAQSSASHERGAGIMTALQHVPDQVKAHLQSVWDALSSGLHGLGDVLTKPGKPAKGHGNGPASN